MTTKQKEILDDLKMVAKIANEFKKPMDISTIHNKMMFLVSVLDKLYLDVSGEFKIC